MSDKIFGIHAVLEALEARKRSVTRVLVAASRGDGRVRRVLEAAHQAGVPVLRQPAEALHRLAEGKAHQGVVALVSAAPYADPEHLLKTSDASTLFVVLDGVEDPRNLGAVVRASAAAGAQGLFLPERGAAGLTAVAVKASAGATERLAVARVGNVVSLLKALREKNIWVVGFDSSAEAPWTSFDLTCPVALVFGGEGKGLRRLARETCDVVLSIPMAGGVESLNLSVAAGIVLFEAVRQRRLAAAKGSGGSSRGA